MASEIKMLRVFVDELVVGIDHACGWFVQGLLDGKLVLDRDAKGMATVSCPNGQRPLTEEEFREALEIALKNLR